MRVRGGRFGRRGRGEPRTERGGRPALRAAGATVLLTACAAAPVLSVTGAAEQPTAAPDLARTRAGEPVVVHVLANDRPAGARVSVGPQPLHGRATSDGTVLRFTPEPGFKGRVTMTYRLTGTGLEPAAATVTVVVLPPHGGVVAVDDRAVTVRGTSVTVSAGRNDTYASSPDVRVVRAPRHGSVVQQGCGTGCRSDFRYTPAADFTGEDSFVYEARGDRPGAVDRGTVRVLVTGGPPEDGYAAVNDDVAAPSRGGLVVDPRHNDAFPAGEDGGTWRVVTGGRSDGGGTLQVSGGQVTYRPADGFQGGVDTFSYTLLPPEPPPSSEEPCDPESYSCTESGPVRAAALTPTGVVTVLVDGPVAHDDTATTYPGDPVTIPVFANDTGILPGDHRFDVEPAAGGDVRFSPGVDDPDAIVYTPRPGFRGDSDEFRYWMTYGGGDVVAEATVQVRIVTGEARDDTARTDDTTPVRIDVLDNDVRPAGDILVTEDSPAATVDAGGVVTYTPGVGFDGGDTFGYAISAVDADGGRHLLDRGRVDVLEVEARDDDAVTPAGAAAVIGVRGNDRNASGLQPVALDADHGTVTAASHGRVRYAPDAGFDGLDTFTYTLQDGARSYSRATVRVTVVGSTGPSVPVTEEPSPSPTPSPTPTATPTPTPTPSSSPPDDDLSARLSEDTLPPGAGVSVAGSGCPPGVEVTVTLRGRRVGTATADSAGGFRAEVDAPQELGRHRVDVSCGDRSSRATLDVVTTTATSALMRSSGTAAPIAVASAVLLFFLLSALGLNPARRRPAGR